RQVCRCQTEDRWRAVRILQCRARMDATRPVAAACIRICETPSGRTAGDDCGCHALRQDDQRRPSSLLPGPSASRRRFGTEGRDLTYLVHENLNESWSALYHADVVADFAQTRLSYACAAHIADDIDETSIPITAHKVLADISDGVWRETVKDFLVGRSFRRD